MPTWIVLVALVVGPVIVGALGARLGVHPAPLGTVVMLAVAAPLTVLAARWLTTWGLPMQIPPWAQVLFLAVVPASIIPTMIWVSRQAAREDAAANTPAGRCGRCAADLFADHTGRRYFSRQDGYLCPPDHRAPGNRRHQVVLNRAPGTP